MFFVLLLFQHGWQKPSFDMSHLRSSVDDVTFEIVSSCHPWLKLKKLNGYVVGFLDR